MGAKQSRPVDDESLGIAEMFARAPSTHKLPLLTRIAVMFPWTRRFVVRRFPTGTRPPGFDSIDSMGEMRAVLSAMGGWDEHHQRDIPRRPMRRERDLERQKRRQRRRRDDRGGAGRRQRSMSGPRYETRDEEYHTARELRSVPPHSLSRPSSPSTLAEQHPLPFPSPYMASLPESALPACPPSSRPKNDDALHVTIASPRCELAKLRGLRHVKDVKDRRGRRRTAPKLDDVDSYAAYLADQSSVDDYPEEWGRKGKGKHRAEGQVTRRGTRE